MEAIPLERGGKTVYRATLGILMLDTQFPRIHGDIGNALTWPFLGQFRIGRGATPNQAVRGDADALAAPFIETGRELEAAESDGVATTVGFWCPCRTRCRQRMVCRWRVSR